MVPLALAHAHGCPPSSAAPPSPAHFLFFSKPQPHVAMPSAELKTPAAPIFPFPPSPAPQRRVYSRRPATGRAGRSRSPTRSAWETAATRRSTVTPSSTSSATTRPTPRGPSSATRTTPNRSAMEALVSAAVLLGAGTESSACEMEKGVVTGGGRIEAEERGVVDLEVEGDDEEETDEDEDEEEDEEEEGEEEEEDGDIQVVPWSTEAAAAVASPSPVASCSSSDESSSTRMAIGRGFIRRVRENANASASQDDLELGYSPSRSGYLGPSPPSTTVVACSGCAHEAETNSVGHRKRTALPADPVPFTNRPRRDRRPHGTSAAVDFFFPVARSPPI